VSGGVVSCRRSGASSNPSIANPAGAIWSAALMLEHLGDDPQSRHVLAALEAVCRDGTRTADIGGSTSTAEMGEAVDVRLSGVAA
jgi:tartrate dehydrogenase/decarboxylase/D-malate dehydrogenase